MNCQRVTRILDERDISRLSVAERDDVKAHLSVCPLCAAEWRGQLGLAAFVVPPLPAGFQEQIRVRLAGGVVGNTRRARNRVILVGTIVAIAAAAAWLGVRLTNPAETIALMEVVAPPQSVPSASESPAETSIQSVLGSAAPEPRQPALPPPDSASFTVRVPQVLSQGLEDPVGNALTRDYRERLIVRLRTVPRLVISEPVPRDDNDVADYEVRISFTGRTSAMTYTAEVNVGRPVDLDKMASPATGSVRYQIENALQRAQMLASRPSSSAGGIPVPGSVSFPTSVTLNDTSSAAPPNGTQNFTDFAMDRLIQAMRVRIFPLDSAFQRELIASVADSTRTPGQRESSLGDVLAIAESHAGLAGVDEATIRAGAELALTTTQLRTKQSVWEALRRTKHPQLVQYLASGLKHERETQVRLQIVQILNTEFHDNPQARLALENASRSEAERVVRMSALRAVQGDSKWYEFAAETLHDERLSDLERLQPIADMVDAAVKAGTLGTFLSDQEVRQLVGLIKRAAQDDSSSNTLRGAARNSLTVLAAMDGPGVRDALIDVIRMPGTAQGVAAMSITSLKSVALKAAASRYPQDPEVRNAIKALANASDPFSSGDAQRELQMLDMIKMETSLQK